MNKILKFSTASLLAINGFNIQADTLSDVQTRGSLNCGVSTGLAGFSSVNKQRKWVGLDVDFCRAVAAATLGNSEKVKYIPLTAKERFTALQSGEIDVLARTTTWTLTRDASLGLNFAGVNYYDGQGFMVMKSLGVKDASQLNGATFCVNKGTTTELNLADYAKEKGFKYKISATDTIEQSKSNFETGRCDVLTTDQSRLYALRTTLKKPSSAIVLPNVISKEPLGPVVRQNDEKWFNIVSWTLNAMITAEELGVTSKTVDKPSKNAEVNRLLGKTGLLGEYLGLDKKWSYNIIKQVGNYSESFERHIGVNTPINITRGLNALWKDGGILYSPPLR
ncbi:Glutamate Aspartate periplasmic binding protein precursor GltI (TC 3.A.1.3.4) [Bathymodiolus thermophilus thioautotrophic gill symbiont]|uniref:L-amino acid ABC transporter (Glu/Asp/His/...), substrate-binding protein AapJ n=1 Tax=Bathymodiolus thermophilus thioautotrophic gill symbiont TaxID=2360 RepID=A0A8H8XB97_9GAMM|nr:amino acid ABC transporter substrate-binding protein [Bathymodiolus thermophilus thioautotrophic gill symbiont]CAB5495633.1 L-amino acid ABC transporter (Glu/Asp/His/...), substrate-binding protein AapJ [Bathymodiolus thermophilus thioautotrophic gill symbiont]SHA29289.1 Glutamate Aspartate periplasmic binding protein precursor GltI (TC 3.A.1.3.4) [Bathymodiolus thermophilus thioautotrophic gill symbiont]